MTTPLDPSIRNLNTCGCCAGIGPSTPAVVFNRPGLDAIAYRTGTWHEFKRSLLAALGSSEHPELAGLTTRDDDDFTIALLDAVAVVADVLTFYQERIANEAYLRTATERLSILQLARLIGYELRPGVAAATMVAFTLEDAPGSPGVATIDVGTKVQSVPGQGEKPQTFETVEALEARAEWNAMRPTLTAPQVLPANIGVLYLAGTATGLRTGDCLVFVGPERAANTDADRWDARRVTAVEPDFDAGRTKVSLGASLRGGGPRVSLPASFPGGGPSTGGGPSVLKTNLPGGGPKAGWGATPVVYAARVRASIFGHNAPDWKAMSSDFMTNYLGHGPSTAEKLEWPDFDIFPGAAPASDATSAVIDLDAAQPSVVAGGWVVLATPETASLYSVSTAVETSRAQFGLAAKTSRLTLGGSGFLTFKDAVRGTTVYAATDPLTLAEAPVAPPVTGLAAALTLTTKITPPPAGRTLVVTGLDATTGADASETVTVDSAATVGAASRLAFTGPLSRSYDLVSVRILGNIARATHGESVAEVLGAGSAGRRYQQFSLRQPPLTFVRDKASTSGAVSTLAVRVNDLLWDEVPSFYQRGPTERIYVTRQADDGTTTVRFGDGVRGARLPTGAENVRASYRKAVGRAGNVKAGQLSTLLTKPLGVKSAVNPAAASGGDDQEPRDAARTNAPLTVLTLDRVVSLRDYEDFARAYAGIGKALATWTWDGQHRGVFITVAGAAGVPVTDDVTELLLGAIRGAGDPYVPVRVATYRPAAFTLAFKVKVDPAYVKSAVENALGDALRTTFGFAARAFGQSVAAAEVIATLQGVPGVVAVDVDTLVRSDGVGGDGLIAPLPAALPQADALSGTLAAELLTLAAAPIAPGVMA